MPGAGTHVFIANEILNRLNSAQHSNDGMVKIDLEPVNGSSNKLPVILNEQLVSILSQNPASFRAGAISPDFFPDVFFGITISHQPYLKDKKNLTDYISNFTESVDFGDERQVAYLFGWLTHLCADVFGHHWVGIEAQGDFETWVKTATTNPDVIRKHIGIEMLWDKTLPATPKNLAFEKSLIQHAMLHEGASLCKQYYNYPDYQPLHAIIKTVHLGRWHGEQAQKITQFRDRLQANDPSITDLLKRICPNCTGLGMISSLLPKECPNCQGIGTISQLIQEDCPVCQASGFASKIIKENCPHCQAVGLVDQLTQVKCPTCRAAGFLEENCQICNAVGTIARNCPICGGDGKIDCPVCGGDGKVQFGLPCPVCLGTGGAPCPSHIISQTCPNCQGARLLKKTCPTCAGNKLISQTIKVTCPVCQGAKVLEKTIQETCPNCNGAKILEKTIQATCPVCLGRKVIDVLQELPCPVCTSGVAVQPLHLICNRLITYHQHRQEHTQRIVDSYLNAHEQVADCILNDRLGDILECYESFWDEVQTFVTTQISFIELVAPELQTLEEQVVKLIETALDEFKEMIIPDFIEEIKDAIVKNMAEQAAKIFNLTLTESEENHYREIFKQYEPQKFPPLANAIQLYLLSLNQVSPTATGLQQAVSVLGNANNIDKRCQPFLTKPFQDSLTNKFSWAQYFYNFLDGDSSFDYCEQQDIPVRNTASHGVPVVDQENNPATWGGDSVNITSANQVSQTLIPSRSPLLAVDLGLKTGNPGHGGDQVTLKVFDSHRQLLASTSASIPEGFDGFWRFELPGNGVAVIPGQPITLQLEDTGKIVFFWKYQDNNPYPAGQGFFFGSPFGTKDFLFRTYCLDDSSSSS